MRVTRYPYDVPGWGVGEVWVRDGIVIQHELASETLRSATRAPDDDLGRVGVGGGATSGHGPDREWTALAKPTTAPPNGGAGLPAGTVPGKLSPRSAGIVSDLCRRVAAHLAGDPTSYDGITIDLDWATPLQRELAAAARAVPWGEVVSYGELAALAGRPGAARAAGSFCADNRYSLIIPCHRVVAANGIGGYGAAGPALKRRLLALEGVDL